MALPTGMVNPRRVQVYRQVDLPSGIAYAWHRFPYSANEKGYVAGLGGSGLALIPERDVDQLDHGMTLRDIHGFAFMFGVDRLDQYYNDIRQGYLPVGFVLAKWPLENTVPTETCLRCGSQAIYREYNNDAGLDIIACSTCEMVWGEPYSSDV